MLAHLLRSFALHLWNVPCFVLIVFFSKACLFYEFVPFLLFFFGWESIDVLASLSDAPVFGPFCCCFFDAASA
jgi:hypothetical protein